MAWHGMVSVVYEKVLYELKKYNSVVALKLINVWTSCAEHLVGRVQNTTVCHRTTKTTVCLFLIRLLGAGPQTPLVGFAEGSLISSSGVLWRCLWQWFGGFLNGSKMLPQTQPQ